MTFRAVHLLLTLGAVALSCSWPTDARGCSIPRSAVLVAGVLTSTNDLRPGSATFRIENATLDSVRVTLRIP